MRSWLLTSISSLILFSTISYIGHFHNYWRKHSKAYERASVFIKTETCTNPRVRATLGEFNLCDESESILSKEPFERFKTMEYRFFCFYEFCCSKKIMNISVFVFFPFRNPNSLNPCLILMFFISNHTYYSWETISKCLNQSGLPLRGSKTTLKLRYDVIFHRL